MFIVAYLENDVAYFYALIDPTVSSIIYFIEST